MSILVIDPGHGGSEAGACANGIKEKDINLEIAKEVAKITRTAGIFTYFTREGDTPVDLGQRCVIAKDRKADLFISIHHNAGGGKGYEIYHHIKEDGGHKFSDLLAKEYESIGQVRHGAGVMTRQGANGDYYAVLRGSPMPAIISEFAYMDSSDINLINTPEKRLKEAQAIGRAVLAYFGAVSKPEVQTPAPTPKIVPTAPKSTIKMYTGRLLKMGCKGEDVKDLQRRLGGLVVDGVFGDKTKAQVLKFQKLHGLVQDGVAGPNTMNELYKVS